MIQNSRTALAAGFALALTLGANAAFAATAAKPETTTTRTPQSIECSKQADAKGLHGKERETFRSACKRDLAKTTAATPKSPAPTAPATPK